MARIELTTFNPDQSQVSELRAKGWTGSTSRSGGSTFRWRRLTAGDDAAAFFQVAAESLAIATGYPTSLAELEVALLDVGSDAGWAQAGCIFALPGMLIGGANGLAWALNLRLPLGGLDLLIGTFVGASIAYLGGGFAASLALRLGRLVRQFRPASEVVSYGGFLVGSLGTALAMWLVSVSFDP